MRQPTGAPFGEQPAWTRVIVIDGEPPLPGWGGLVASGARVVVADGGARHALREGVGVTDLIGDLDTLGPDEVDDLAAQGVRIHRFPPDKNFTDFELAARLLAADTASGPDVPLLVVGGAGGRLDHALGTFAVLTSEPLASRPVTALVGAAVVRVAVPSRPVTVEGASGTTVSLLPFPGAVRGVTTRGLAYPLVAEDLSATATRGLSNVVTGTTATVHVAAGTLLVIEPFALTTPDAPPSPSTSTPVPDRSRS